MPEVTATFPAFFLSQGKDRQAIINGNMQVWQRGESFHNPPHPSFIADRFTVRHNGTLVNTDVSKYVIPQEIREQYGLPMNALLVDNVEAPTGQTYYSLQTIIPDVSYGAAKAVSIGFWAWADSNISTNDTQIIQHFGSGGSPSSDVFTGISGSIQLSTTPQYFEFTASLPSIDGKTLGINGDDNLRLYHNMPRNQACKVYYTGFQMNIGSQVLPVIHEPYDKVLADCERFYERIYADSELLPMVGYTPTDDRIITALQYSPKWRNDVEIRCPDVTDYVLRGYGSGYDVISFAQVIRSNNRNGCNLAFYTAPGELTINRMYCVDCGLDEHYIEIDAEL